MAATAYPFAPALSWLDDDIALLELYHGPTCAFKDFGASFLATILERRLGGEPGAGPVVVLVATSGDTGGAVARAFWRREGIEVVLLYPSGRISRLQEQQLTALGDNIHAVEIAGSFDDCQRLVKQALIDRELVAAARLCPANSISLGRLLPQAFYYIFAGLRLRAAGKPLFCVPSGNFGNLTAGVYAAQWGLPVAGFWAVTNRNDVVPELPRHRRPAPSRQRRHPVQRHGRGQPLQLRAHPGALEPRPCRRQRPPQGLRDQRGRDPGHHAPGP